MYVSGRFKIKILLSKTANNSGKELWYTHIVSSYIIFINMCFIPESLMYGENETMAFFASPLKILRLLKAAEVFLSDEKGMGYFLQLPKDWGLPRRFILLASSYRNDPPRYTLASTASGNFAAEIECQSSLWQNVRKLFTVTHMTIKIRA